MANTYGKVSGTFQGLIKYMQRYQVHGKKLMKLMQRYLELGN